MSGTVIKSMNACYAFAMLVCLAACTPGTERNNLVTEAYNSSGMLAGVPYKRSIFSSTDF